MKLNHLSLAVPDVLATHSFLQTYLNLEPLGESDSESGGLTDENGIILTLFRTEEVSYPEPFHVGFIQESQKKVDAINARLKADGYDVPPPSKQHGSWTFYFTAPGGFTLEVLAF